MFRLCAGDAAPGSSQTAFGSGSPLLAPLSNFRAGTLPTTVSLPPSHKPQTDSLPACLAARFPSLGLCFSSFVFFCLSLSLFFSLSHSHSIRSPAMLYTLFFFCGCWSVVPRGCPSHFPCVCLFLCLQDYRPVVSLAASKSSSSLPLSLVISPAPSFCWHLSNSYSGPALWL